MHGLVSRNLLKSVRFRSIIDTICNFTFHERDIKFRNSLKVKLGIH